MKVLHVGWGFFPIVRGGYIEHVEDLMRVQSERGYQVFYFCAGRKRFLSGRPGLKRWRRGKVVVFEVINSPVINVPRRDVLDLGRDLDEPVTERYFRDVLKSVKPDVVHFQHLMGLPSSLLTISKNEFHLPTVMTLQDYYPVCPCVRLFDGSQKVCSGPGDGTKCLGCYREIRELKWLGMMDAVLGGLYFLNFVHWLKPLGRTVLSWLRTGIGANKSGSPRGGESRLPDQGNLSAFFQKRFDVNIKRLNELDRLIMVSQREKKIYEDFLGSGQRSVHIPLTVGHVEHIRPRSMVEVPRIVKFATLSGCSTVAKGACLISESVKILNERGLGDKFEFHIYGAVAKEAEEKLRSVKNVFSHGVYPIKRLDALLTLPDVGIVPSLWEEVYGYVGLEFIAKGIPVIGNKTGGIPDYVVPGATGWLNETRSPEELADIMMRIIQDPGEIVVLNKKIIARRDQLIKTMGRLFLEMEAVYQAVV